MHVSALKTPKLSKGPLRGFSNANKKELSYSIEVLHLRAKSNSKTTDKYGQENK